MKKTLYETHSYTRRYINKMGNKELKIIALKNNLNVSQIENIEENCKEKKVKYQDITIYISDEIYSDGQHKKIVLSKERIMPGLTYELIVKDTKEKILYNKGNLIAFL